jgi:PEP-CTERM motif
MKFRTVRPGWHSPVTLACALALAAPLAHAQIQATATLSNLSVRVQDLNTSDRIKPTATWGGALYLAQDGSVLPATSVLTGPVISLPESPYSTGTLGQSQVSMNTTLGAAALENARELPGVYVYQRNDLYSGFAVNPDTGVVTRYVDEVDETYASAYISLGQSAQSGFGSDTALTLTLAPGTLAVVSGDMFTSVTTDSRWLSTLGQQLGFPPSGTGSMNDLNGQVTASIELLLEGLSVVSDPNGGSNTTRTVEGALAMITDEFNANGLRYRTAESADPLSVNSALSKSFAMVVQNWGTEEMVYTLNFMQRTALTLSGSYTDTKATRNWDLGWTVPTIPEPGTWLLMALGMAGVAWAGQRRTQQDA